MKKIVAVLLLASVPGIAGAQFMPFLFGQRPQKTDFSHYANGVPAPDWSYPWGSANISSTVTTNAANPAGNGKVWRFTIAGNNDENAVWNRTPPTYQDAEVLAVFKFNVGTSSVGGPRITMRGGGTNAAKSGYLAFLYSGTGVSINLVLGRTVAGAWTTLTQTTGVSYVSGWYWIRMQTVGSTIRAKYWRDGTGEPGAWQLTFTDSSLPTGWIGFGPGALAYSPVDVGFFSVNYGTSSALAP